MNSWCPAGLARIMTPPRLAAWAEGEDVTADSILFDELFDYYMSSGDMPYGVAKARTGDPDQWIEEQLEKDIPFYFGITRLR